MADWRVKHTEGLGDIMVASVSSMKFELCGMSYNQRMIGCNEHEAARVDLCEANDATCE